MNKSIINDIRTTVKQKLFSLLITEADMLKIIDNICKNNPLYFVSNVEIDNTDMPIETPTNNKKSEIKHLGIVKVPTVTYEEFSKQKEATKIAANVLKNLEERNETLENEKIAYINEINCLKQQNNNRKSAMVINTIAGIIIAIEAE